MKKLFLFFVLIVMAFALASCGTPEIVGYHIDETGKLIATYDDQTTVDLGSLSDTIANGVEKIEIDESGYYVINDIKTAIKAKLAESYAIDVNGNLIVTYTDTTTDNLGKFSSDAINTIDTISISDDGFYVLNGIKTNIVAVDVFEVNFVTGFDAAVKSQIVKDGNKVERPQLDREGYTFEGWFCNGEEWRFNSDVVKNEMTLTAKWKANEYQISFENAKGISPENITATFGEQTALPSVNSVEGYTFAGWYNENNPVSNGKWAIASDVKLTVKWTANTYTITLNANGGNVATTTKTVTYGESFTLPVPTNSYGVFTGWLYNGEPVTDSSGKALSAWLYPLSITVTVDWSIKVYTANDLKKMATYPNGDFILMNDIDLNGIVWTPIGTVAKPFTGHLNGNSKTIKNLNVTANTGLVGLFGYTNKANIEYLSLADVFFDIPTASSDIYCGALVGWANDTTINRISVSGEIITSNHSSQYTGYTGGIVGWAYKGKLSLSTNNAIVTGAYSVGGICGSSYNVELVYCINNGNITSTQSVAGGIVGFVDSELSKSASFIGLTNHGTICAAKDAGGIVGSYPVAVDYSAISTAGFYACGNYGNISGGTDTNIGVGGIIGNVFTMIAEECFNQGNITNGYGCGGIVGFTYANSSFANCYSSGSITSTFYTGGIAGYAGLSCSMTECVVFGTLSSSCVAATTCGSTIAYAPNISNFYYNCSCPSSYKKGISTSERYSSGFYLNTLFFDRSIWSFNDSCYPNFVWESEFNSLEI